MLGQQKIINSFLSTFAGINYGMFHITLPDGRSYSFGNETDNISATFEIHDFRVITNLAAKGDIGLTESYRDGDFSTDNLTNFLIIGLKNEEVLNNYIYSNAFNSFIAQILYFFNGNSLKGSKRNISAHYDLGNAFYKLWLDKSMTYSSGIYGETPEHTSGLEQAQHNKYDRIVECLEGHSGSLIEVGCGWGGFAERALTKMDADIKGITISQQQFDYATHRLNNKANIALEDYRLQTTRYDYLVSIEMFEAVGEKYWGTFFNKIKSLLKQKGKAVIQTITIEDKYFTRYRKTGDMIRSFIFPGGMLPSITRFYQEAHKAGLKVEEVFMFGKDYEQTLRDWSANFEATLEQIKQLGFDDKFINVWRFYLSACIASFHVGRTNVAQVELSHA